MSLELKNFKQQIDANTAFPTSFFVMIEWPNKESEIKEIWEYDFPRYEISKNNKGEEYYPRVIVLDTVTVFPNKTYDLSTEEGQNVFYQYLREGFKFGKREFRIAFQDGVRFIIHPLGKDGETKEFVLTTRNTI